MSDIRTMRIGSSAKNCESALTNSIAQLNQALGYAADLDADLELALEGGINETLARLDDALEVLQSRVLAQLEDAEKELG